MVGALDLFRALSTDALADACAVMRIDKVARNALIVEQGEPARRAYALGAGSVRIAQTGEDGGQAIIRFIGPGEMFGTVPLFTDHRFPADAIAAEESLVLSWSEHDLLALIGAHPTIAINLITILGTRLAELQERVRELATQRIEQRIAQALLRLASQAGQDRLDGVKIEFPLRRKDLADYAGTTLHSASRMLAAWEKAGLLTSRNLHLTIHNIADLRRIAESSTG
jgi:CRP-like cAMP-binding protein